MNGHKDKSDKEKETNTGIWMIHVMLNNLFKSVCIYTTHICTCKGIIEGRTVGLQDTQDKGKLVHYMS
jgi:hypothetical protein